MFVLIISFRCSVVNARIKWWYMRFMKFVKVLLAMIHEVIIKSNLLFQLRQIDNINFCTTID